MQGTNEVMITYTVFSGSKVFSEDSCNLKWLYSVQ